MEINNQIKEVLNKHKSLAYDKKKYSLSGKLFLPGGDSYDIIIKLDPYPRLFPIVYETGGRIPIKMDRHIYIDSGSCCFTTRAKAQVLLKTKITSLLKFIDEIVVRYFENNSYYEINGKYCFEEHTHGLLGILEGYQDVLGVKSPKLIIRLMLKRVSHVKLRLNDLCYCNSGKTLKKCNFGLHERNYRDFRLIEKQVLRNDLSIFYKYLDLKSVFF